MRVEQFAYRDFGIFILGEIKGPAENRLGQCVCGWVRDWTTWHLKESFCDPMNMRVSWHYSYESEEREQRLHSILSECGVQSDCFLVHKGSQICWSLLYREENLKKPKLYKEELKLCEFPREEYPLIKYLHYSGCTSAGSV